MTIPTQAGYAALQNVPLGAGQSAASRQAVLSSIGVPAGHLRQNPVLPQRHQHRGQGVAIETGQTNLNIGRSEQEPHLARSRRLPARRQRQLHGPVLAERQRRQQRDQQPRFRRTRSRATRTWSTRTSLSATRNLQLVACSTRRGSRWCDATWTSRRTIRQADRRHRRRVHGRRRGELPAVAHQRRLPVLRHTDLDARKHTLKFGADIRYNRSTTRRRSTRRVRSRSTTCRTT